jgi:hypothetical protein
MDIEYNTIEKIILISLLVAVLLVGLLISIQIFTPEQHQTPPQCNMNITQYWNCSEDYIQCNMINCTETIMKDKGK